MRYLLILLSMFIGFSTEAKNPKYVRCIVQTESKIGLFKHEDYFYLKGKILKKVSYYLLVDFTEDAKKQKLNWKEYIITVEQLECEDV